MTWWGACWSPVETISPRDARDLEPDLEIPDEVGEVFFTPSEGYVEMVALVGALLAGARVDDAWGAGPQRERGPEYVVVLVSEHFDGVPWLERVYVTGTLWDAYEMGAPADMHSRSPSSAKGWPEISIGRVRSSSGSGPSSARTSGSMGPMRRPSPTASGRRSGHERWASCSSPSTSSRR